MAQKKPATRAGKELRITAKGLAYLAAMNAGVIPRNDQGSWDGEAFNRFWEELKEVGFFDYLRTVGPDKPLANSASAKWEERLY